MWHWGSRASLRSVEVAKKRDSTFAAYVPAHQTGPRWWISADSGRHFGPKPNVLRVESDFDCVAEHFWSQAV